MTCAFASEAIYGGFDAESGKGEVSKYQANTGSGESVCQIVEQRGTEGMAKVDGSVEGVGNLVVALSWGISASS